MKKLLFAVLFFVSAQGAFAQNGVVRCGTVEYEAWLREQGLKTETDAQFEAWLSQKIAEARLNQRTENEVYTIPVVFHVLFRSGNASENISAAQIQSQLDILNEDFGRYNPDTNNTPLAFRPVAANTGIQFCMAQRTPTGLPSTGINRIEYPAGTTFSQSFINNTVKPATIWNPNDYLNIWIAPLSGGLLGYAQFPTGSTLPGLSGGTNANTDGVVILHTSVGRPPQNPFSGIYTGGRTATHEVGHYLGLRHIWGDGGCGVDDFCNDTPESDAANYNCPTTHVSCGTLDMVQNYMDYTQDNCMNIYTADQTTRMRTVMQNSPRRVSLRTSLGCIPPTLRPSAGFLSSADSICTGGSMSFSDTSTNQPTAWRWLFPGGSPDTALVQSPSGIVYANSGTYNVTLIVTNASGSDTLVRSNAVRVVSAGLPAQLNNLTPVCAGDTLIELLDGLPRGGTYSGTGVVGGRFFNPQIAGAGQHLITYTPAGCSSSDTAFLTVNGLPTVNFTLPDTLCVSAAAIALSATPAGGSFSGLGVSGGQFNPAGQSAGNVSVIYTYTNTAGCTVRDTELVVLRPRPTVTFSGAESRCINEGSIQLTASPAGGVFSGPGVSAAGSMNLQQAGVGNHTVTYTYTDGNGCINSGTRNVVVSAPPTINFGTVPTFCVGGNSVVLSFATPTGGSFSGPGMQFGVFNPSLAGAGTHKLYYTAGIAGCTTLDSVTLTVLPRPEARIERIADSLRSATVATAYQWYKDGVAIAGATNRVYQPLENGLYGLTIDSSGCNSVLSPVENFFFTSVDLVRLQQIVVFQNPSENGIFRLSRGGDAPLNLELLDAQGRKLKALAWQGAQFELDLQELASGIYLLRLHDGENVGQLRLIKQ